MSRIYRVPYSGTLTAAGGDSDLLLVLPATNKPCRLVGYRISQISEVGDAAEEALDISIIHMTATVTNGSGGTTPTPVANRPGTSEWAAAGFTVHCNDTTVATTSGVAATMDVTGWNERNTPYDVWIPEEFRPQAIAGEALIVRVNNTVADDISIRVVFLIEEL